MKSAVNGALDANDFDAFQTKNYEQMVVLYKSFFLTLLILFSDLVIDSA